MGVGGRFVVDGMYVPRFESRSVALALERVRIFCQLTTSDRVRSRGLLCCHTEYRVGVVDDDECDPGQGAGWVNTDGRLVAAAFVQLRVIEVGIVLQVLVGVLLPPTYLAICLVLFSTACNDTIAMTRRTTLTRPDDDSG